MRDSGLFKEDNDSSGSEYSPDDHSKKEKLISRAAVNTK